MSRLIDLYLDRVMRVAELSPDRHEEVRAELADHLDAQVATLKNDGIADEEANFRAIKMMGHPRVVGSRLTRPFRWIDVRTHGTAKGVLAIGPRAVGVFAFGGVAVGVVAIGGVGIGLISLAGLGLGLVVWAGVALGLAATGGVAAGGVAAGGVVIGLVAAGGVAYGLKTLPDGAGGAFYPAGSEPAWLAQVAPLMKIPEFILSNIVFILPLYLLVIFVAVTVQTRQARRLDRSLEDWVFD